MCLKQWLCWKFYANMLCLSNLAMFERFWNISILCKRLLLNYSNCGDPKCFSTELFSIEKKGRKTFSTGATFLCSTILDGLLPFSLIIFWNNSSPLGRKTKKSKKNCSWRSLKATSLCEIKPSNISFRVHLNILATSISFRVISQMDFSTASL